ncbi:hypothetical protein DCC62_32470 [candidate division KSB1 bacterium]|nr:MAG: hypothetical protein DCC62_32470 [candidate division KSB1 bacterium]
MQAMIVFVDEAGDTGLKLKQGSSQFFIITLVIFDEDDEALACDQRIALLRRELGVGQEFEFHFNETPHRIKDHFFKAIVPYNFFYVSTIINKKNLYGEGFKFKNSFYKYVCRLVFDNVKQYLEHAIVVFDGSGSRQFKQELATYLRKRMNDDATLRVRKVKMQDSKNNNLIQLADMVCGAVNLSLKSAEDESWEYRRLIGHRELSARVWPQRMNVEKREQYKNNESE